MATAKSKTTKNKTVSKVAKVSKAASTAKNTKKPVPKTVAKAAPKTGAKTSTKSTARTAKVTKVTKPAAKPAKPVVSAAKAAKKPTPKTVPKTVAKATPKPAPKAPPKAVPKAAPKAEPKVLAKVPAKPAAKATVKASAKAPAPAPYIPPAAGGPKFAANVPASPPPRPIEKPPVKSVPHTVGKVHHSDVREGGLMSEAEIVKQAKTDYMSKQQLAFFKHRLLQLQSELRENAGATTEHLREIAVAPDPADRATLEEEHALELRTRDRERKLLKKVEAALVRIDDGSYGYCEETGEPIGIQRLLARPTATLTIEAQERREMKQKMYGE